MQTFQTGYAPAALLIGRIKRRHAGSTNTLRWALYVTTDINGPEHLSNTFAADLDRDGVAELLAENGLALRDDNSVVSLIELRTGYVAALRAST